MKRTVLSFVMLTFCIFANANDISPIQGVKLPDGYQREFYDGNNKKAYFINSDVVKGQPSIILSFIPDTSKKDMWFTTCQHTKSKGIQIFTCFTQQGQFGIGSNADGRDVIFRFEKPKEIALTQINYKIDNKKIRTLPVSAIPNGVVADTFIRQLKEGNVLSFSWKEGSQYKVEKINLNGLAESLLFAKKMIELNN